MALLEPDKITAGPSETCAEARGASVGAATSTVVEDVKVASQPRQSRQRAGMVYAATHERLPRATDSSINTMR